MSVIVICLAFRIWNLKNLIMMGTGPFAVPTFEMLYATGHTVCALFTQPPRPVQGKKNRWHPNPMRDVAEAHDTPVFTPESVNTPDAQQQLQELSPDLLIVCDYGQILAPATLQTARFGGINLHASLLPKYRGAAPINWAIYHGDRETGNTVIHMTPKIDAGPAIAQQRTPIGPEETADELEQRMAEMGAELTIQAMEQVFAGTAQPIEQNDQRVTRARRLRKSDGEVDWSRTAEQIRNQVRAFCVWPKTFTHWLRPDKEPLRVTLTRVEAEPSNSGAAPGEVIDASGDLLTVAAGEGAVTIRELQPAGKRPLAAAEFLRGYQVETGQRFGSA